MYIHIRSTDGKIRVTLEVSKTLKVWHLKKCIEESQFNIKPENQRLFFRGKQLEDEYTLFDYSININDVIQIMEKVVIAEDRNESSSSSKEGTEPGKNSSGNTFDCSKYFKVGDFVDAKDTTYGAWFEGKINKIYKDDKYVQSEGSNHHDEYIYEVTFLDQAEQPSTITARLNDIRPRAQHTIAVKDLKLGDRILVNYNIEAPGKRGFWYEAIVTEVNVRRNTLIVEVKVSETANLRGCKIIFTEEILKIEETTLLAERIHNLDVEPAPRNNDTELPHDCTHCKNNPRRKCKECGCHICGLKTEENKQIMCDECDYAFHIWCLKPPLQQIPEVDEWYCHECKNDENEIVSAGSKLKESKKKAKMASKQNNTSRDWGKGMACVARTKACTIVPNDHFGPIPGIEVGTLWKFRIQVSEAGVHRPHVAGIHGRETVGAFSVVLSGGYEDDIDNGDEVYYTGSGGRDLSGNKRTNSQGFDQTLSRFNKALAMNCNVQLNEKGAEATNWRGGKPVRVVRNYKLAKHSKFAPEEGNRYDGIYKVVKYFPQKGKSGFNVWRFLFRRDDPTPAPWTRKGKKRIEELGLEIQYPEGYLEAIKIENEPNENGGTPKSKGKGNKRVLQESPNPQPQADVKKPKTLKYTIDADLMLSIEKDTENTKLWHECQQELDNGKHKFIAKVEEMFTCICCTELVYKPVTTPCLHNFCSDCIRRSFKADVMTCPTCRNSLDKNVLKNMNSPLQDALNLLFPGYSAAR